MQTLGVIKDIGTKLAYKNNSTICFYTKFGYRKGNTMYDMPAKASKVTWQKVLASPFIFWIMAILPDSVMALISTSLLLVMSSLSPLRMPRVPFSVSIACGIIFAIGCGIGGLALATILERLFPNLPTVKQWEWVQWVPSAFGNLAILVWVFVVLNISPVTRPLILSTVLIATAAGYALTLDAVAIGEALVFGVTHEISDWEQGIAVLLNGSALVVWERLVHRKLMSSSIERFIGGCTLFIGILLILVGIFGILWDIFS